MSVCLIMRRTHQGTSLLFGRSELRPYMGDNIRRAHLHDAPFLRDQPILTYEVRGTRYEGRRIYRESGLRYLDASPIVTDLMKRVRIISVGRKKDSLKKYYLSKSHEYNISKNKSNCSHNQARGNHVFLLDESRCVCKGIGRGGNWQNHGY